MSSTVTVEQVLNMTTIQKIILKTQSIQQQLNRGHQVTLDFMDFFTPDGGNSCSTNTARTMNQVQQEVRNSAQKRKQTTLTASGEICKDPVRMQVDCKKQKTKKRRQKADSKQVTLDEKWNTNPKKKGSAKRTGNRKQRKNKCKFKRTRGKHDDVCTVCMKGGTLVECHTCVRSCHIECSPSMPLNVTARKVIWRCSECISDMGPTNCSFSVFRERTIKRRRHTGTLHGPDTHIQAHDTRPGTNTPTGEVIDVTINIECFISSIYGRIVYTHPDGHCLRRAMAKIWNLQPGQLVRYLRNKCTKMIKAETYLKCQSDAAWYATVENRPAQWDELVNNEKKPCTREQWATNDEAELWSAITNTIVIELNVEDDMATIHYPDVDELSKMISVDKMKNEHDNICGKVDKKPQYVIYGQNHYNAVIYNNEHLANDDQANDGTESDSEESDNGGSPKTKRPREHNNSKDTEDKNANEKDEEETGKCNEGADNNIEDTTHRQSNLQNENDTLDNEQQIPTACKRHRALNEEDTNQGESMRKKAKQQEQTQRHYNDTVTADITVNQHLHQKRKQEDEIQEREQESRQKWKRKMGGS